MKFQRNAHSPEAAEQIIATMGWRTNQQVRASYLVEDLTVPALLDAIQRTDVGALTALETKDGFGAFALARPAAVDPVGPDAVRQQRQAVDHRSGGCAILEGAMEAFTRRAKMYGVALS